MRRKRLLAVGMAMVMVLSTGMTAMAETTPVQDASDGTSTYDYSHTEDEGDKTLVHESNASKETERNTYLYQNTTIEASDSDQNAKGSTDFAIRVDKDASSITGKIVDEETAVDGAYIETKTITKTTLSVTVPLYVCMYGYGGDGKVVVPGSDTYKMLNSSYETSTISLESITPLMKVTTIDSILKNIDNYSELKPSLDKTVAFKDHVNEIDGKTINNTLTSALIKAGLSDPNNASGYGYYYHIDPYQEKTDAYYDWEIKVVALGRCEMDDEGEYYYKDTDAKITTNPEDNDITAYYVAKAQEKVKNNDFDFGEDIVNYSGKIVRVASIEVEDSTAGWKLVDASTSADTMMAKQLAMTIKGYDLYQAYLGKTNGKKQDIIEQKWNVPSTTNVVTDANKDSVTPGKLELPISAAIAGNGVNADQSSGVLKVTYTIVPMSNSDIY